MSSETLALLEVWRACEPETIRHGRTWYRRARKACREIAADTGYSVEQVAAVLAITSPDAQLVQNVRWARSACETRGAAKVGRYPGQMGAKVRAVLADPANPGQYATGPKVSAFFRAIMGDTRALVVDRWAAYAVGHSKDHPPTPKARRVIEEAYRAAAAQVGINVRDFQAVVWTHLRRSATATRRGSLSRIRYADI